MTVYNMLLKVSSIDNNTKLDALDIDSNQGSSTPGNTALLRDNWPVDISSIAPEHLAPAEGER